MTAPQMAKEIRRLIDKAHELVQAKAHRFQINDINDETEKLQEAMKKEFARQRGWSVARSGFTLHQLRKRICARMDYSDLYVERTDGWDHPAWFKCGRKPAGITIQPYGRYTVDEIQESAPEFIVSAPDFPSWWYPGKTQLFLIEAKKRA